MSPLPLLGVAPDAGLLGTAMYASSRAAQCMYCSAHSCAVAMRGGAARQVLEGILDPHDPAQAALAQFARGMSLVPATLAPDDISRMRRYFSPDNLDWLAHIIAMMGYLNKMMDAMGFDLEGPLVQEIAAVAESSGWTPGRHNVAASDRPTFAAAGGPKRTLLAMLPHMPAAIWRDRQWTQGVPSSGKTASALLAGLSGYEFPMVGRIRQGRIVRTLTTMLRDNLDESTSVLGMRVKHSAGLVYAAGLGSDELVRGARVMAQHCGLDDPRIEELCQLGYTPTDSTDTSEGDAQTSGTDADSTLAAAIELARAMSPTPARVTDQVVGAVMAKLSPEATIELVTWFSLISLLNRSDAYQEALSATQN